MPHLGQAPGTSLETPGHIGQMYFPVVAAAFDIDSDFSGDFAEASAPQQSDFDEAAGALGVKSICTTLGPQHESELDPESLGTSSYWRTAYFRKHLAQQK
ncbi:MAG: hypothetical protein KDB23_14990 [Planctomycetales bacterium]|nr:hypothetical protein [Planctomycetales bacterium]